MKKLLMIIGSVLIVLLLIITSCFVYFSINIKNLVGVRKIEIVENNAGDIALVVGALDISGYQVCKISNEDKILLGEKEVAIEDLGEYRIMVEIFDSGLHEKLDEKHSGDVHNFTDVPKSCEGKFKVLITYTQNHSVAIYIGSDEEISIKEQYSHPEKNILFANIKIPLDM